MPRPGRPWAEADPSENWTGVSDPKIRRRLQNRLNARAHRRRKAIQREEELMQAQAHGGAGSPPHADALSLSSPPAVSGLEIGSPEHYNLHLHPCTAEAYASVPAMELPSALHHHHAGLYPGVSRDHPAHMVTPSDMHDDFMSYGHVRAGGVPASRHPDYSVHYSYAAPHMSAPPYMAVDIHAAAAPYEHRGSLDVVSNSTWSTRGSPVPEAASMAPHLYAGAEYSMQPGLSFSHDAMIYQ